MEQAVLDLFKLTVFTGCFLSLIGVVVKSQFPSRKERKTKTQKTA